MYNDLITMAWKEMKVQFRGKTKKNNYLRQIIAPIFLSGIIPITWGPDWVNEFPALIIAFITPALIIGVMIPDSFAGERERHTLDTLLASRLPDRAILFGKIIMPFLIGWGAALVLTLISLVVVNLAHTENGILLFTPSISAGIVFLSFLSASLTSSGGILTSLAASSTQEAAQKLMSFVLIPAVVLQIVPLLFQDQIGLIIKALNGYQFMIALGGILLIVDMIILMLAMKKFSRSEMYLV
jgi:ABC-2 type transport system permease protein